MPIANHVIAGQDILASDFNTVIDAIQDTTTGHDHSGAEDRGKKVAHADLSGATDNAVGGNTHAEIDAQLVLEAAHRTGLTNVHGLTANSSILGSGRNSMPESGNASLNCQFYAGEATITSGNQIEITLLYPGTSTPMFGWIFACGASPGGATDGSIFTYVYECRPNDFNVVYIRTNYLGKVYYWVYGYPYNA